MKERTPRRTNEEWLRIIQEAKSSGTSDFQYCKDHGITLSTYYRAIKRLHTIACEVTDKSPNCTQENEIVPINISELPVCKTDRIQHEVHASVADVRGSLFEATIRISLGGSTVELSNDAEPSLASAVLHMLNHKC
ncbi:hypothetical protein UYO_3015 [Lachnospiraceae bacterium JC7]|nr:hypothetical protein UYO_3015 [Lachnospiraceae bacterium JC7]